MSTLIIGLIVAGLVFIAVKRVMHDMKQPGCSGCAGCSMKDNCDSKK